ncbi:MAG: hypothetical protein QOD06_1558 [Candidatus Binatota bacterium]|nr:hypothetical protein [Candidatus Binatota bacterium]
MGTEPTVIIRECPDYDAARIRSIVRDALHELDLRPFGRTLVKPNCVASGPYFPHTYTRPEFLEGVLLALKDRAGSDVKEIALGERCGITFPTRYGFKGAGYYEMLDRVGGVRAYHFDEVSQVEIPLYHEGRLRDAIFTPEPVAAADFFVNCPKFKAHPWTTVTFSMKNYIGIQDDRHRLIDHDDSLNQKVADLQYVVQPQLIAIDAIVAGEGRMLTPIPFDMKLVILGNNQVAFDAVCCRIIGIDPLSVDHIRLAYERGFGPVEPEKIRVTGDVSLADAQRRASSFRSGLIRVDDYFQGTNLRAYGGPPPGDSGYCWGGCPGALEEAIEVLRLYDKDTDAKTPKMHVVFGAYDGPIEAKEGEPVIFMGDCASYHGQIAGKQVDMPSVYRDRSTKDPLAAKHDDIFVKMAKVNWKLRRASKEPVFRMAGCPVSVAEQALALIRLGKLKNPFLDPGQAVPFTSAYLSWRTRQALARAMGRPYNRTGPYDRGTARPAQNFAPGDGGAQA